MGKVSGSLTAEGPVMSPILQANFVAHEYSFFDPKLRKEALTNVKARGPAIISAKTENGKLDFNMCVSFLEQSSEQECTDKSSFIVGLSGPFAFDQFSLDAKGSFDYAHWEDVVSILKNELVSTNSAARFTGRVQKKRGSNISYDINLGLERLLASLPNIPEIRLVEPVTLIIDNNSIRLTKEAVLAFSPGQLKVFGSMSHVESNIHVQGTIPLMLTRLFTPIIQKGEGLAAGDIVLSGKNDAPTLQGEIVFEPGASLTLRRWLDPIDIREGKIAFKKTSKNSFTTILDNIRLAVGDGKISIDGSIEKHPGEADGKTTTFNLDVQGSNINIHDRLDFVETDFRIRTVHQGNNVYVAQGEIVITDGSAERQFDLRNFVAQARTTVKPGIVKFLDTLEMRVAMDIEVRQFSRFCTNAQSRS